VELLKSASPAGRREALAWRSKLSTGACEADLALDAQRRTLRRAHHHGAADDVDPAPSAASAVGMAAPRALTLGTTGSLALAAAEALLRCPATFMAFTWRVG